MGGCLSKLDSIFCQIWEVPSCTQVLVYLWSLNIAKEIYFVNGKWNIFHYLSNGNEIYLQYISWLEWSMKSYWKQNLLVVMSHCVNLESSYAMAIFEQKLIWEPEAKFKTYSFWAKLENKKSNWNHNHHAHISLGWTIYFSCVYKKKSC